MLWVIACFSQEKLNTPNIAASAENAPEKVDAKLQVPNVDTDKYYTKVDQVPEFIGGKDSLLSFLAKNIRYPKEARKKGIQGKVYIRFVVERDGSISDVVATQSPVKSLEEESVKVVELMPKWKPGMINGVAVRSYYMLPITYKLE